MPGRARRPDDGADDDERDPLFDVAARGRGGRRGGARPRTADGPLRVAFVGRPNAGKSSLTNRLLGEERSLVHDEAGTTTDPVDAPFSIGGRDYVLVDTAGIRRKAKIDADIEKIAVVDGARPDRARRRRRARDRRRLGPAEQDARIAGKIEEAGRALVIALNKCDLVAGEAKKAALSELTQGHVPLPARGRRR